MSCMSPPTLFGRHTEPRAPCGLVWRSVCVTTLVWETITPPPIHPTPPNCCYSSPLPPSSVPPPPPPSPVIPYFPHLIENSFFCLHNHVCLWGNHVCGVNTQELNISTQTHRWCQICKKNYYKLHRRIL